jgi:hypothetical protein
MLPQLQVEQQGTKLHGSLVFCMLCEDKIRLYIIVYREDSLSLDRPARILFFHACPLLAAAEPSPSHPMLSGLCPCIFLHVKQSFMSTLLLLLCSVYKIQ